MKVLGIYGSPRRGGNSDILLDKALESAQAAGAEINKLVACDLNISGCIECGSCDGVGECVLEDDMTKVYAQLEEAEAIILAAPMFFYGVPAQCKALMDRCQAMWCKRMLNKSKEELRHYSSGRGYFIGVGATKGSNLFEGAQLTAKYWFDALDMSYHGGMFVRSVEGKGDILKHEDYLQEASELGKKIVSGE